MKTIKTLYGKMKDDNFEQGTHIKEKQREIYIYMEALEGG